MFWVANLQKINFMLDIVTKLGKCYYKMGSFLFYKTGKVLLQNKVRYSRMAQFLLQNKRGEYSKVGQS